MLNLNLRTLATALAFASVSLVTGCGVPGSQAPIGQPGMQNPWNPGGGGWPGGPIPPGGTAGCVPITSPIGFQGQGVYVDYANIVGGTLPYGFQTVGQMWVSGGGLAGGQLNTRAGSSDGMISMNLQQAGMFGQQMMPQPYGGFPNNTYWQGTNQFPTGFQQQPFTGAPAGFVPQNWNPNTAAVQGTIQLSQLVVQDIIFRFGGGMMGGSMMMAPNWYQQPGQIPGYPTQPGFGMQPQVCVSGIAMNMGRWNNLLYGGKVYLYLNGTQHGYTLHF